MAVWIIVWIVGQFSLATCQLIWAAFVWRGCVRPIAYKYCRIFFNSRVLSVYRLFDMFLLNLLSYIPNFENKLYHIRTNNENNHNIQIEIGTYTKNCHYQRLYLHGKVVEEEYFLCPKIIKVFFQTYCKRKCWFHRLLKSWKTSDQVKIIRLSSVKEDMFLHSIVVIAEDRELLLNDACKWYCYET